MDLGKIEIIALLIFIISYFFIITEKFHRTVVAILGASLVVIFKIISQKEAFHHIDFNTLGMLIGMMIIVEISKDSGLFEYLAIKMIKLSKGKPVLVFIYFILLTGFLSAILDNVTTVLLIAPITFLVTDIMKINIYPFLIAEIFSSNIGGTATLIGDPPNILIGSRNNIPFNDFILNLGPVSLIVMGVMIFLLYIKYKSSFKFNPSFGKKLSNFNEKDAIKDISLLKKSVCVITGTLILFALHDVLHIMPATVALSGAGLLMILSIKDPEEFFEKVEWNTIFFFAGLFVIVAGIEKAGFINLLGEKLVNVTQNRLILSMIILWSSSILVCVISSVPLVITMIPVIQVMVGPEHLNLTTAEAMPLWWALALGACLGGNGTIFASAANLVVAGVAEKYNPGLITFKKFFKEGISITFISILISSIYIYLRYFI